MIISGSTPCLKPLSYHDRIPSLMAGGEKLSPNVLKRREIYRKVLAPFVRTDINLPTENGFQEARKHVENGGGLILYAPHLDQVDPLAAYLPLYDMAQIFKNAPLVYPLALHQGKLFGISVPKFTHSGGVETKLIATESTIRKRKAKLEKRVKREESSPFYTSKDSKAKAIEQVKDRIKVPEKNEGFEEFAAAAEEALRNGGVVYAPVQPERASKLEAPEEKPLGRLALLIKRKKIPNVGILIVGMDVDHSKGYEKARGLNLGKTHTVTIGPFFTLEQTVQLAGKETNLDAFKVENIVARLVNSSYLNPDMARRLGEKLYIETKERKKAQRDKAS